MRSILALVSAGCAGGGIHLGRSDDGQVDPGPPVLLSHDVACSVDNDTWRLEAVTTGFSAGASTWWTADGVYVERHDLAVLTSAPDGSEETFDTTLAIVSDWREQGGSSTAFVCAAEPTVVFQLEALDGAFVDCFVWGPNPTVFDALRFVPECG